MKPMNWIKIFKVIKKKSEWTIVWCFDVLDECIKAEVEEERTKTIMLKYIASNRKRCGSQK